jgi:hypothetical protein
MKKFVVERNLPGAGNLSIEELRAISQASCKAINELGMPYHWVQTFVTDDKLYCIHIAESADVIRAHAKLGNFPINMISEVRTIIDPTTSAEAYKKEFAAHPF